MDDTNEMQFEPGAVVVLRSGSPGLTVLGTDGDRVRCLFFSDELGEFRETSLPALALTMASDDEDEEEEAPETSDDEADDEDEAETTSDEEDEGAETSDEEDDGGKAAA